MIFEFTGEIVLLAGGERLSAGFEGGIDIDIAGGAVVLMDGAMVDDELAIVDFSLDGDGFVDWVNPLVVIGGFREAFTGGDEEGIIVFIEVGDIFHGDHIGIGGEFLLEFDEVFDGFGRDDIIGIEPELIVFSCFREREIAGGGEIVYPFEIVHLFGEFAGDFFGIVG